MDLDSNLDLEVEVDAGVSGVSGVSVVWRVGDWGVWMLVGVEVRVLHLDSALRVGVGIEIGIAHAHAHTHSVACCILQET